MEKVHILVVLPVFKIPRYSAVILNFEYPYCMWLRLDRCDSSRQLEPRPRPPRGTHKSPKLAPAAVLLAAFMRNDLPVLTHFFFFIFFYTPLLCAGDYMKSNPPGITTKIPKDFKPDPATDPGADPWNTTPLQDYSSMSVYRVMKQLKPVDILDPTICLSPPTLNPRPPLTAEWYKWRHPPWRKILRYKQFFPPGHRWVLRNLTQKEYVYVVRTCFDEPAWIWWGKKRARWVPSVGLQRWHANRGVGGLVG